MRPYLGPPWTDSHPIWAVEVFHHAPPIHGIQNTEIQKKVCCDVFASVLYRYNCVGWTFNLNWTSVLLHKYLKRKVTFKAFCEELTATAAGIAWEKCLTCLSVVENLNGYTRVFFPLNFRWGKDSVHKGDPRPCIPPRAMASSAMGSNWEYSGFCRPHTRKQMQTKCVHNLRMLWGISRVFIFKLRTQMHLTNHGYFDHGNNAKTPIWASCRDKNGTGCRISLVYLWARTRNFQSPLVPVGDDAGWGEGGFEKNTETKAAPPPGQKLTNFWCFKYEIRLSDTVF